VAGDNPRARIAVINDDTIFLQLMEELLRVEQGYAVGVCKQWDDAYGFVKEFRPDLVILDVVMSDEEAGWRILNLLTLDPATRPIPVLVCSAAVRSLHEHQALLDRYGIRALSKPFDLDTLLSAIDAMLEAPPGGAPAADTQVRRRHPTQATGDGSPRRSARTGTSRSSATTSTAASSTSSPQRGSARRTRRRWSAIRWRCFGSTTPTPGCSTRPRAGADSNSRGGG
jgi:CheY-like chemotaxis protein